MKIWTLLATFCVVFLNSELKAFDDAYYLLHRSRIAELIEGLMVPVVVTEIDGGEISRMSVLGRDYDSNRLTLRRLIVRREGRDLGDPLFEEDVLSREVDLGLLYTRLGRVDNIEFDPIS
ncbi:hypothetical protein MLD52_22200 [Puniceicoccaceae bacterium K14]|nr:hypothetical protein [Puniceicoccaceae bacterium K14]